MGTWISEFVQLLRARHIRETAALISDKCKNTDRLVEKLWFCSQAGFFKELFISGSAQLWFLIRLRDKANLPRAPKRFLNGKNSQNPQTKTSGRSDLSNVSVPEKQQPLTAVISCCLLNIKCTIQCHRAYFSVTVETSQTESSPDQPQPWELGGATCVESLNYYLS